ncbi:MAG: hypothetical protein M3015_13515 [Bacteroidota bacterium]|nr:hypothetical protein [Bacteroidota bacterium]
MKEILSFLLVALIISLHSCGQTNSPKKLYADKNDTVVGGSCEGCEAVYESPVSFKDLKNVTILPDYNEAGPKMQLSGIIYKADGKTPAPDVILYVYHTDQTGNYTAKENATGWGKRHSYIRGWLKTNAKGEYKIYTLRPAPYPQRNAAAHIHAIIKEPGKSAYWIDEYLFDDDPLVTADVKAKLPKHGGMGLIKLHKENGILMGHRDIILGVNIPGYPKEKASAYSSGLEIGSDCPAFDPLHISGGDAGTRACPMCKYGKGQGIMLWINNPSLPEISSFTTMLDNEVQKKGVSNFRVFLMYMKPPSEERDAAIKKLISWTRQMNIRNLAVTLVPSATDATTAKVYNINSSANISNTVFIYKKRMVTDKMINIDYNQASIEKLMKEF